MLNKTLPQNVFGLQLRKELTWDRLLGMVLDAANGERPALVACKTFRPVACNCPGSACTCSASRCCIQSSS